jgi:hypothetical protein
MLACVLVWGAAVGVPAVTAAATDEATVAAALPAPVVELGTPSIEDGRLHVCVTVRWRPVPERALDGRPADRVASTGTVRLFAYALDRRSGPVELASAERREAVDLDGERTRTCFRLSEEATGDLRADGGALRGGLFADAVQAVDADRDRAAEAVGAGEDGPAQLGAKAPCDMSKVSAVTALQTCRNWTVYAAPSLDDNAPPAAIEAELRFLARQGFRGLVTYTVNGTMSQVPRIARKVGFQKVIVGLYDPAAEIARVDAIKQQIDGVVVGNEGIGRRYSIDQLEGWVTRLKAGYPKLAITSTNEWYWYLPSNNPDVARRLMRLGDFLFPNLHAFWDANPASNGLFSANPNLAAQFTKVNVDEFFTSRSANPLGLPVILKEAWWPDTLTASASCPLQPNAPPGAPPPPNGPQWQAWNAAPYSEAAQRAFFTGLMARGVKFVWGEPFDIPVKSECKRPPPAGYGGLAGPHWGLWRAPGKPKQVVAAIDYGRY